MNILQEPAGIDHGLRCGVHPMVSSRYQIMAWLSGKWSQVGRTDESRPNALAIAERAFQRSRVPMELRNIDGETVARYL